MSTAILLVIVSSVMFVAAIVNTVFAYCLYMAARMRQETLMDYSKAVEEGAASIAVRRALMAVMQNRPDLKPDNVRDRIYFVGGKSQVPSGIRELATQVEIDALLKRPLFFENGEDL